MTPYDPTASLDLSQGLGFINPSQPTWKQRLLAALPRMLQGGIDAAATPNVAFGGPLDVFRALQNAGQMGQQRDLLAWNMQRQRMQDALNYAKEERARQDELRKLALLEETQRHQNAMESAQSRRLDLDELAKQASEIGAFSGRGGEFAPAQTEIAASPLQLPPMPEATSAADLPVTPPPQTPLSLPTPAKEGYQFEPSLKYDIPGTRRMAPTAQTLAKQKKTAEQENWPTLNNQDQADFFNLPIGAKVSPGEFAAWSAQHRQDTKPIPPKDLRFEHFTNDVTGDVTTIGFDPLTGEERTRSVAKGIAKKAPPESPGTWSIQEDATGKPVQFNSKTGEVRPVVGVQRSGTKAKADAAEEKSNGPARDALSYAQNYLNNGVFTGSGDEALQEKFFDLAKPTTGFRMTKPQMDMLQNSRNWMNSVEAKALHATTGRWFTDKQRREIVQTMTDLANAKMKAGGSSKGASVPDIGGMFNGQKITNVEKIK